MHARCSSGQALPLMSGGRALLRILQKRGDLPVLRVSDAACSDCVTAPEWYCCHMLHL